MPSRKSPKKSAKPVSSQMNSSLTETSLDRLSDIEIPDFLMGHKGDGSDLGMSLRAEFEEDYFLPAEKGVSYGRCGGRPRKSPMEKRICEQISKLGLAHSHAPRRFEVKIDSKRMAAYSPCIALRGRGREGKTTILEVLAVWDDTHIQKIRAFRAIYKAEFFVIFVAPGSIVDRLAPDAYDEVVLPSELHNLITRLSE